MSHSAPTTPAVPAVPAVPKRRKVCVPAAGAPAKKRKTETEEEEPEEKAERVAREILKDNKCLYSTMRLIWKNYEISEREKKGHEIATDILAYFSNYFDVFCNSKFPLAKKVKEKEFDRVCGLAKNVLFLFRMDCDRWKLMRKLLEDGCYVTAFPWSVIKDDLLMETHGKEYMECQVSVFQCDLGSEFSNTFYLATKERVLKWFGGFDKTIRSDPESVKDMLVAFCDVFCDDIIPLWKLCNVDHSREFVEEVYSECFTDAEKEEDLKHVEKWMISLGYDRDIVKEIKKWLW